MKKKAAKKTPPTDRPMKALESAAAAIARMQERSAETVHEAAPAPMAPKEPAKKAAVKKKAKPSPPKTKRILLADGPSAEHARKAFESEANVTIDTTPLAARAFELAVQQDYDLIVLALDLPECSGEFLYEMIQNFYRHEKRERYIPAVAYIADEFPEKTADHLRRDARVKGLIERPVTREKIRKVVATVAALKV